MKTKYYLLFMLLLPAFLFYFNSCGNDTTVTPEENGAGTTQSLTSNDQGNISFDGFRLLFPVGTVPHQANGTAGTVVFSLNSSGSIPSGLIALPSGYTAIGKFL